MLALSEALAFRRARRLGLVQVAAEARTLFRLVRDLAPRRLLEIGTAGGGTLCLFTRAARPDATVISVDLPPWPDDPDRERKTVARLSRLARRRQSLRLLRLDSHALATRCAVRDLLAGAALDFLFLDGDHTLSGVARDFEDYVPLVRPGGLVALHDVHPHSQGWGGEVPRFFASLEGRYRTRRLVADPRQDGFGIGLVFPEAGRPLSEPSRPGSLPASPRP